MECACINNQVLRGAAVNAYLNAFLRRGKIGETNEPVKYICRICGTEWYHAAQSDGTRAQLIRMGEPPSNPEK